MANESASGDRLEMIAAMALFADLHPSEITRIVDLSRSAHFSAGDVIVDQGDPGTDCFIIESGTANVYVRGDYVATSGPGSMIGEMALIDHRPRTATVLADTDLSAMRFDSPAFRKLLEENPKASERIFGILRDRLDRLGQL